MVKWNFSVQSNTKKEGYNIWDIEANTVDSALEKISTKELEKILKELKNSQKDLDKNKLKHPKVTFEASISMTSNFGSDFIPLGITLKNIEANSIPALIKKVKQIEEKPLEEKYRIVQKEKEYDEMKHLPEESTLSVNSFVEFTQKDVEEMLKERKKLKLKISLLKKIKLGEKEFLQILDDLSGDFEQVEFSFIKTELEKSGFTKNEILEIRKTLEEKNLIKKQGDYYSLIKIN